MAKLFRSISIPEKLANRDALSRLERLLDRGVPCNILSAPLRIKARSVDNVSVRIIDGALHLAGQVDLAEPVSGEASDFSAVWDLDKGVYRIEFTLPGRLKNLIEKARPLLDDENRNWLDKVLAPLVQALDRPRALLTNAAGEEGPGLHLFARSDPEQTGPFQSLRQSIENLSFGGKDLSIRVSFPTFGKKGCEITAALKTECALGDSGIVVHDIALAVNREHKDLLAGLTVRFSADFDGERVPLAGEVQRVRGQSLKIEARLDRQGDWWDEPFGVKSLRVGQCALTLQFTKSEPAPEIAVHGKIMLGTTPIEADLEVWFNPLNPRERALALRARTELTLGRLAGAVTAADIPTGKLAGIRLQTFELIVSRGGEFKGRRYESGLDLKARILLWESAGAIAGLIDREKGGRLTGKLEQFELGPEKAPFLTITGDGAPPGPGLEILIGKGEQSANLQGKLILLGRVEKEIDVEINSVGFEARLTGAGFGLFADKTLTYRENTVKIQALRTFNAAFSLFGHDFEIATRAMISVSAARGVFNQKIDYTANIFGHKIDAPTIEWTIPLLQPEEADKLFDRARGPLGGLAGALLRNADESAFTWFKNKKGKNAKKAVEFFHKAGTDRTVIARCAAKIFGKKIKKIVRYLTKNKKEAAELLQRLSEDDRHAP